MIQLVPIDGQTNQWQESDTMGVGDLLLGGLTNPFTGKPSSQAQQWMTIVYSLIIGIAVSALFFSKSKWFQQIAAKRESKLSAKQAGDLAYAVGKAEGRNQAYATI